MAPQLLADAEQDVARKEAPRLFQPTSSKVKPNSHCLLAERLLKIMVSSRPWSGRSQVCAVYAADVMPNFEKSKSETAWQHPLLRPVLYTV